MDAVSSVLQILGGQRAIPAIGSKSPTIEQALKMIQQNFIQAPAQFGAGMALSAGLGRNAQGQNQSSYTPTGNAAKFLLGDQPVKNIQGQGQDMSQAAQQLGVPRQYADQAGVPATMALGALSVLPGGGAKEEGFKGTGKVLKNVIGKVDAQAARKFGLELRNASPKWASNNLLDNANDAFKGSSKVVKNIIDKLENADTTNVNFKDAVGRVQKRLDGENPIKGEVSGLVDNKAGLNKTGKAFDPSTAYVDRNIATLNKNGISVKSPNDIVTLYHGVSEKSSSLGSKEAGNFRAGTFLATDKNATKLFAGEKGKIIEIKVPASDLGFVQDGGMAGSKGVSIQTIDDLVKGKDGIYRRIKK